MQSGITVEARALGRKKPLFPSWSIPLSTILQDSPTSLALRDLITRVVLEEVHAFQKRQAERRLVHLLTAAQIELGVERGKVDMGGRDLDQYVDPLAAVDTALQAFDDGLYFVFVDGDQVQALEDSVRLGPGGRVSFVRLVALAGG
jgi:hypothetical protein